MFQTHWPDAVRVNFSRRNLSRQSKNRPAPIDRHPHANAAALTHRNLATFERGIAAAISSEYCDLDRPRLRRSEQHVHVRTVAMSLARSRGPRTLLASRQVEQTYDHRVISAKNARK